MTRILLMFVLVCVGVTYADTEFITSVTSFGAAQTTVGTRPNVGFRLQNTTNTTITITELGRWVRPGNNQTHVLSIYNSSAVQLASVTVDCEGAPVDQFLYGTLSVPYDVPAGGVVYITSLETNGGDAWYNNADTVVAIGDLGTIQSAYVGATVFNAGNNGGTYTSAGPVNFKYSAPVHNWTKDGANPAIYSLGDCEQYTLDSAIFDASEGDIINGPPGGGSGTWGANGSGVRVNKSVSIRYSGPSTTTITIATSAPTQSSGGAINVSAAASIGGFSFNQGGGSNTTGIKTTSASGWRITDIDYESSAVGAYFIYAETYGLIDHVSVDGGAGNDEWIYARGPSDSWQTPSTLGSANAVYLENSILSDQGYTDFNANARGVVRFCTINPLANYVKLDWHGTSTNVPVFSARSAEIYNNTWSSGTNLAIEIRGGSGVIFNNINAALGSFYLTDYCYRLNLTTWGIYLTPYNYPSNGQIGTGQEVNLSQDQITVGMYCRIVAPGAPSFEGIGAANNLVGTRFIATDTGSGTGSVAITPASEPMRVWGNQAAGAPWHRAVAALGTASSFQTDASGYGIGTTVINLASRNTAGSGNGLIGTGDTVAFAGDSGRYLVTSGIPQGSFTPRTITIAAPGLLQAIPASAVTMTSGPLTAWQRQSGNPSATFTERDMIQSNRDFFADEEFDTNTGVTVGTYDDMQLYTPSVVGYSWWVTDRGDWNTQDDQIGTPGYQKGQGQLWTWDGAEWEFYYEPYTYPHPLQGAFPTQSTATVNSTGTQLTIVWSESCTTGAGGNGGLTLSSSGGAVTPTYDSGSGSDTYVYTLSRTINAGEIITDSYTQPGDGIESTATQEDVLSFSGLTVINGSTVNASRANTLRTVSAIGGGF